MESGIHFHFKSQQSKTPSAYLEPACNGPSFYFTTAQADALAHLIQCQLDAYTEAVDDIARPESPPFSAEELALLEPLLHWLKEKLKAGRAE